MKVDILTLFPEMFAPLNESIIGRAKQAGKIEINIHDIRDYTKNKHKKCDDYPFGGGAGMVMMAQPIADAIKAIDPDHKAKRIFTSPKGSTFTQKRVKDLIDHIVIGYDKSHRRVRCLVAYEVKGRRSINYNLARIYTHFL